MRLEQTALPGVYRIVLVPHWDERGYFMRVFDEDLLAGAGLEFHFPQQSVSVNTAAGIIRGMHFQAAPHGEVKIIQCVRGRVFDVLVDVRQGSASRGEWQAFELSEDSPIALYVPAGFAHGYQTLTERADLYYLNSEPYAADATRGVRYDDPALAIPWPLPPAIISERDKGLPPLASSYY